MIRRTFGTYSMDAPPGWTLVNVVLGGPVEETQPSGLLTTKAVPAYQRNMVTSLEKVPDKETPEKYLRRQIDGLRQANVPREQIGAAERVKLQDGLEGLLTEQVLTSHDGERVRQLQLVVIVNGVAHTAIASHLDGAPFESAREELKSMLLSFGRPQKT